MSELVPTTMTAPQEMRFQDGNGKWMLATVVDGQLVVRPEASSENSIIAPVVQQMFDDVQNVFDREMEFLIQEQLRGHQAIELRYRGKALGKQRADRAKYEFDRDVIRPKMLELQMRQADRIAEVGNASHQISIKLAANQAEQRITLATLEDGDELREKQSQIAIGAAKNQVAIQRIHDSRDKGLADEELGRLERLEKSRADIQVQVAKASAESTYNLKKLETDTELEVAKLNVQSQQTAREEAERLQDKAWEREDRHRTEDAQLDLIRRAQSMVRYIPQFEAAIASLNAEGPEDIARAASAAMQVFLSERDFLANASPDIQPQIAERMLAQTDILLKHYLTGRFAPKDVPIP